MINKNLKKIQLYKITRMFLLSTVLLTPISIASNLSSSTDSIEITSSENLVSENSFNSTQSTLNNVQFELIENDTYTDETPSTTEIEDLSLIKITYEYTWDQAAGNGELQIIRIIDESNSTTVSTIDFNNVNSYQKYVVSEDLYIDGQTSTVILNPVDILFSTTYEVELDFNDSTGTYYPITQLTIGNIISNVTTLDSSFTNSETKLGVKYIYSNTSIAESTSVSEITALRLYDYDSENDSATLKKDYSSEETSDAFSWAHKDNYNKTSNFETSFIVIDNLEPDSEYKIEMEITESEPLSVDDATVLYTMGFGKTLEQNPLMPTQPEITSITEGPSSGQVIIEWIHDSSPSKETPSAGEIQVYDLNSSLIKTQTLQSAEILYQSVIVSNLTPGEEYTFKLILEYESFSNYEFSDSENGNAYFENALVPILIIDSVGENHTNVSWEEFKHDEVLQSGNIYWLEWDKENNQQVGPPQTHVLTDQELEDQKYTITNLKTTTDYKVWVELEYDVSGKKTAQSKDFVTVPPGTNWVSILLYSLLATLLLVITGGIIIFINKKNKKQKEIEN